MRHSEKSARNAAQRSTVNEWEECTQRSGCRETICLVLLPAAGEQPPAVHQGQG
jgi:hypothetical protein